MKLGERDDALQLLERLYDGCAGGRGAVVLTNGPVGSGKTALVSTFAERAVERGALYVSVTASASEQLHLFGLAHQLVTAMRAVGMAIDPFAAEDVGVTVSGDRAQETGRAPIGLLQRIFRTVREYSERQPLVIGIDDVHFADEPSLQCLRYLIRRIDSSAVMIVMSESSCHDRQLARFHAEILHLPYCHQIRLAPLTCAGIAEQLTERLGVEPAPGDVDAWAEAGGGSPLLLNALLEDLSPTKRERAVPEPGESFRGAVLRCLHRGDASMLAVARVLAVLGESATPSLLGDFLGGDARTAHWSIADLTAAGLVSGVRFRHEYAQLAVLADIPAEELPVMHGRAAELLHKSGASAVAVAEQLMAAHDSEGSVWRVDILREAAREAMSAGDVQTSVDYLRHALAICTDPEGEAQITAALADAQWHIDPDIAGRHLQHLHHLVRVGMLSGEEATIPVKLLLWRGEFARAEELLRRIETNERTTGGRSPEGATAPDVLMARLWLSLCRPASARDTTEDGADVPSMWSGPVSAPACSTLLARLTWDGEEIQGADQVLHRARADSPLASTLFALVVLIQSDRVDDAVLWTGRLLQEPWIARVPVRRALFETVRSVTALRRGELAEAEACARTALEVVAPSAWGVVVGLPLALAVRAATELGELDTVMSYVSLPVPPVMFDTPFALPYLQALGRYHLAMGRPHTALTNFQNCGDLMSRWGLDAPDLPDWRNDAAAALVAMGRTGEARELIEEQLSRPLGERSRVRGIALRRLAAASEPPERPALLREAVRIFEACGDRLELAYARAELEEALAAPDERLRHEPSRPRTPGEPAAGGGKEPAPVRAELTDAERRVAALAAEGRTNREIAGRLFITVSTVEQHLTKIYRKLNVRRRADLPTFPNRQ
ncbi:helix-turn-helix transcriptional regulator [Streptomyces herbicida]|uniref:helix-turn-helix transcriptional regulator n=1 Tax=Streptomyces herbicida TaxID=3065675 RepID=UPI00292E0C9A|nr:AAA family ATPase [Streptomyces sp. NEAU-HV9]